MTAMMSVVIVMMTMTGCFYRLLCLVNLRRKKIAASIADFMSSRLIIVFSYADLAGKRKQQFTLVSSQSLIMLQ